MLETFATGHINAFATNNQSINQSKMGTTTLETLKQTRGIK